MKDKMVGLGATVVIAFTNFVLQYSAGSLFQTESKASQFLTFYSASLLATGYLVNLLFFRSTLRAKVVVDPLSVAAIFIVCCYLAYEVGATALFAALPLTAIFVVRDYLRIFGLQGRPTFRQIFVFVLLGAIAGGIVVALFQPIGHSILITFTLLIVQVAVVAPLSISRQWIEGTLRSSQTRQFIRAAISELLPALSGYLVLVKSADLLPTDQFIELRADLAVLGLSALCGGLTLVWLSRKQKPPIRAAQFALFVSAFCAVGAFFWYESQFVLRLLGLGIFVVSAAFHAANRIFLDKALFFKVSAFSSLIVVAAMLFGLVQSARGVVLLLVGTQSLHIALSFFCLRHIQGKYTESL